MKIGYGKMKMISGANSCLTFKTKKKMKKILFMVAAVALMAMVSCNKENANDAPQVKEPSVVVEFSASISMGDENTAAKPQSSAATRTTVDHSVLKNPKTLWLKTDEISINGVKFKVKELINGGASAVFVNEGNLPNDFAAPYKAVYPYEAVDKDGKIVLPAVQTAIAGDFPKNAVCAAAYSNDAVLKFKNVASVLMFQVAKACQTVTISSDNALAGTVSMTPNGDDEIPIFSDGTEKTVTINGSFEVGNNYYVAVLPGTKANFVVRHDGYLSKNAASVTIARKGFANMGTLPAPVETGWYVQGLDNWTKSARMYKEGNWSVAYNVKSTTKYFKFEQNNTWVGGKSDVSTVIENYAYSTGDKDIQVKEANKAYDFYFCKEGGMFMILPAGTPIDEIYVATDMFIRGNYTKTGYGWEKGFTPTIYDGKYFAWKNMKFDSAPEFKFITVESGWNGYEYTADATLTINSWKDLKNSGGNTKYGVKGTYDIYTTSDGLNRNKVIIVKSGDSIPQLQ